MHVELEAVVELQKTLDAERCQQKRHRQSGRIDGEKKDAFPNCVLGCGESEHNRENRTDAGRPSKGKSKSNDKSAPGGRTAFKAMQSRVRQQGLDLQQAGQVQAEENDDRASDAGEQRFVLREHMANFSRNRTLRDEDDAKANDKSCGIEHHLAEKLPFLQL